MLKSGIDHDALIEMFANTSAKQSDQLRGAVSQAVLGALRGRELTLKNIRSVLQSVTQAASAGAAKNVAGVDVESLLDNAVAGMDDALLKAVEANQVALQQFVAQGVDLQEKHLKKAFGDLEKMEDMLLGTIKKSTEGAQSQLSSQWGQVLEKMQAGGTLSGAKAASATEDLSQQMQTAVRDTRAAGLKAAQALAESYSAMVSGVLIGMSDALKQGTTAASPAPRKK